MLAETAEMLAVALNRAEMLAETAEMLGATTEMLGATTEQHGVSAQFSKTCPRSYLEPRKSLTG